MLSPLAFLVALTSASMAQELLRARFCIGSGNCPVVVQVMKNCGSDADQIAQEICTVRRGGERRELEYKLLHEGPQRRRKMLLQLVYRCLPSLSGHYNYM